MKEIKEIREFSEIFIPQNEINFPKQFLDKYKNQLDIEPPWIKNDYQWHIKSKGWVGFLPLSEKIGFSLLPKVSIENFFGMLTYAYKLQSVLILDGKYNADNLNEFYDYLAYKLAEGVLNRNRKGLFREYVTREEELAYVCGRIDIQKRITKPWVPKLAVEYQEYLADIKFNQILTYTLYIISHSGFCSERILPIIHTAFRTISKYTEITEIKGSDCKDLLYNRLNKDYEPLHILCNFFLDHLGPKINIGDRTMIPFLINMENLFEQFVAEWLKSQLPEQYLLEKQKRIYLDSFEKIYFATDIVIKDKKSKEIIYILDTKYKDNQTPDSADLAQVIAYASEMGCKSTALIYPMKLSNPIDLTDKKAGIRKRTLAFDISGDLQQSGNIFLNQLIG